MSYLRSLPPDATLIDIFRAYPEAARPLLDYHELVMRGPSPFTPGERELIAAYVSGINACTYCHGVHAATAAAFGVPTGVLAAALADLDTAPVADQIRPVLRYAGKLTRTPSRMTGEDADAVYAAGWDERALHHAVQVCALFNFMNRLVDGLGVHTDDGYFPVSAERLHRDGYAALATFLGPPRPHSAR